MKKIFCIVSAVIIAFIAVMLSTLGIMRKSLGFDFNEPYSINVFYKGSTTINNGESYFPEDEEFAKILSNLKKTTTSSYLNLILKTGSTKYNIEYGGQNYSTYDTSMKSENLVVELIYKKQQNVVVYEGENTRVIPYTCLLFIIPCESKFRDIIVYNSVYNDSTLKEKEYKNNTPFIIKGNPKKILSYVQSVAGSQS